MDHETDFPDLIEDYEANIDDLSLALRPLLTTPLHTTTSTLPLLDKAKLQVLAAYAIESLLYNVLQASNIPAKEHAVFPELARLKSYFAKIKDVETLYGGVEGGVVSGRGRLDKEAAARFIKHGLAGNEKYDKERAALIAKEKAKASLQALKRSQKTFNQADEDRKQAELAAERKEVAKRKAAELGVEEEDDDDDESEADAVAVATVVEYDSSASQKNHVDSENEDFYGTASTTVAAAEPITTTTATTSTTAKNSKSKSAKKEDRKRLKAASSDPKADKAARRAKKLQKRLEKAAAGGSGSKTKTTAGAAEELVVPTKSATAPKSRSQTFSALLDGSFAEGKKKK